MTPQNCGNKNIACVNRSITFLQKVQQHRRHAILLHIPMLFARNVNHLFTSERSDIGFIIQ